MARIGGPIYDPTSVASGVGGGVHIFARFRGLGGVSQHGLQRAGALPMSTNPAQAATDIPGLGASYYPAATFNMTLPPLVPIAGGPRDPAFMV